MFATPNLPFWSAIGVVCLIAVGAGIFLPQFLPNASPAPVLAISKDPADKAKLTYTPPAWPEAPDPQAMFLRLGIGTALVLALCAGTLLLSKRWLRGGALKDTANGSLHLVDTLLLGNRCALHLVSFGNRQALVGTDGSGLKTVVALPEPFDTSPLTDPEDEIDAGKKTRYDTLGNQLPPGNFS